MVIIFVISNLFELIGIVFAVPGSMLWLIRGRNREDLLQEVIK
jgi:hypothetical protein